MKKVEFIKDYSSKKKGDTFVCDSMLAATLIGKGVAKVFVEKKQPKKK